MPTRAGSDVIPLRKETKSRLASMKGKRSYDEVIRALLDATPAQAAAGGGIPPRRLRAPEKQIALARLAVRRWKLATERGEIVELGPRLVQWFPPKEVNDDITYTWDGRRGLAP